MLTDAQKAWLKENPEYELPGPPRPGERFKECGTLYADGIFIPNQPMKPIMLKPGCRNVGIRVEANRR